MSWISTVRVDSPLHPRLLLAVTMNRAAGSITVCGTIKYQIPSGCQEKKERERKNENQAVSQKPETSHTPPHTRNSFRFTRTCHAMPCAKGNSNNNNNTIHNKIK